MFVRASALFFSFCDLKMVQIIFLSPPECVTKSQGNFSFHLLNVESFGTFLSISVKFCSSEKNVDNTSFNLRNVKESLEQLFKD